MSDLSRSLVDAAAEASYLAWHGEHSVPFSEQADDVRAEYTTGGRAAVVAVLETLAKDHFDNGGIFGAAHINELRRLAVEVKSEGR